MDLVGQLLRCREYVAPEETPSALRIFDGDGDKPGYSTEMSRPAPGVRPDYPRPNSFQAQARAVNQRPSRRSPCASVHCQKTAISPAVNCAEASVKHSIEAESVN